MFADWGDNGVDCCIRKSYAENPCELWFQFATKVHAPPDSKKNIRVYNCGTESLRFIFSLNLLLN